MLLGLFLSFGVVVGWVFLRMPQREQVGLAPKGQHEKKSTGVSLLCKLMRDQFSR